MKTYTVRLMKKPEFETVFRKVEKTITVQATNGVQAGEKAVKEANDATLDWYDAFTADED